MAEILNALIDDDEVTRSFNGGHESDPGRRRLGNAEVKGTYGHYIIRIKFTTNANGATNFSFDLTHGYWWYDADGRRPIISYDNNGIATGYTDIDGNFYSLADSFKYAITTSDTALIAATEELYSDPLSVFDAALNASGYVIKHQPVVIKTAQGRMDQGGDITTANEAKNVSSYTGSCNVLLQPSTTYYLWLYSNYDQLKSDNIWSDITFLRHIIFTNWGYTGYVIINTEGTYYKTLTYDNNGGIGGPGAQQVVTGQTFTLSKIKPTKANTTGYTVTLNANGGTVSPVSLIAKDSYSFMAWSTSQDGSGPFKQPGDIFAINSNTTIYAKYTQTKGSVTLPTPTRPGYTFKYWGSSSTATSGVSAGTYTPSQTITLYAVWEANLVSLIFNPNGGTFTNVVPNNGLNYKVQKRYQTPIGNLPIVTRDNRKFMGWVNPSNQVITSSTLVPLVNSITFTALWSAPLTYTVNYITDKGTIADTAQYDQPYTVRPYPYQLLGYKFIQWTTNEDKTDDGFNWTNWSGTWTFDNGQFGITNNQLNLYAVTQLDTNVRIYHNGEWRPAVPLVYHI